MKKITQFIKNRQKALVLGGGLMAVSSVSQAAVSIPVEITTLFSDFGTVTASLLALSAVLFSVIRGGTGVLKIASKFFGAAGA